MNVRQIPCSPLELVESLRAALPATNPMTVQRRMALENVIQMLTGENSCSSLSVTSSSPHRNQRDRSRGSAASPLLPNCSSLPMHSALPAANMFEDVDPAAVLDKRVNEESGHTEWLVKFEDEEEVRFCRGFAEGLVQSPTPSNAP